mmetsp:Transcript_26935/g.70830  ORF Transcript_26935/g.70830 Transcript_26935/m.70830 type:complete len:304 (-) Transcript_26935:245-1156(-)
MRLFCISCAPTDCGPMAICGPWRLTTVPPPRARLSVIGTRLCNRTPPITFSSVLMRGNPVLLTIAPMSVVVPPMSQTKISSTLVFLSTRWHLPNSIAPRIEFVGPEQTRRIGNSAAPSRCVHVPSFWVRKTRETSLSRPSKAALKPEQTVRASGLSAALRIEAFSRMRRFCPPQCRDMVMSTKVWLLEKTSPTILATRSSCVPHFDAKRPTTATLRTPAARICLAASSTSWWSSGENSLPVVEKPPETMWYPPSMRCASLGGSVSKGLMAETPQPPRRMTATLARAGERSARAFTNCVVPIKQ